MFGMGFTEILLIIVIGILFLGPDKLPEMMVKVAKFIKSAKKAISDAKGAIDEEMKIAELKEEAMSYKKQLDEATDELKGFKNVGINPMDDITEAINSSLDTPPTTKQIEPKQDEVTFKKKPKNIDKEVKE
ncbi:Twin-arginine translocation protein TatB [hydrothermal vent metagenome]|uniref:Twin-arginine translocation protein TatB n=1 Tax=hydrothermal vent metagenome TaxID=652676 RepID=A0A1W1BPB7_9ZZZZ